MLKKTHSPISVKLFSKKTTGQMKIISAEIRFRWMNTNCLWLVEGMSMMKIGHPLIAPPLYRQDRNGD